MARVAACGLVLCVTSRLGAYPNQFYPAGKKPFLVDESDPDSAMNWYVHEWNERDSWELDLPGADHHFPLQLIYSSATST